MIRYTEEIKKDFLSPSWCKALTNRGVDLSGSPYKIYKTKDGSLYVGASVWDSVLTEVGMEFVCHTVTISKLADLHAEAFTMFNVDASTLSSIYDSSEEPELMIERLAFDLVRCIDANQISFRNMKGNKCVISGIGDAIYLGTIKHINETHPWKYLRLALYFVPGKDGEQGYAGYTNIDNVFMTHTHVTDKSVYDLFREQHLENWKEDEFYNFVNYEGIKY